MRHMKLMIMFTLLIKFSSLNIKIKIEPGHISVKAKIITGHLMYFDKRLFFENFLGLTINIFSEEEAESLSKNTVKSFSIEKNNFECGCINASFLNGSKRPIFLSLPLNAPPGSKIYCDPKIYMFQKI